MPLQRPVPSPRRSKSSNNRTQQPQQPLQRQQQQPRNGVPTIPPRSVSLRPQVATHAASKTSVPPQSDRFEAEVLDASPSKHWRVRRTNMADDDDEEVNCNLSEHAVRDARYLKHNVMLPGSGRGQFQPATPVPAAALRLRQHRPPLPLSNARR